MGYKNVAHPTQLHYYRPILHGVKTLSPEASAWAIRHVQLRQRFMLEALPGCRICRDDIYGYSSAVLLNRSAQRQEAA